MLSGEGGEGLEGAGGIASMPGPGCALCSSVFEAAVTLDCCLGRIRRPVLSESTCDSLDGGNDPGVLLDTVAV